MICLQAVYQTENTKKIILKSKQTVIVWYRLGKSAKANVVFKLPKEFVFARRRTK